LGIKSIWRETGTVTVGGLRAVAYRDFIPTGNGFDSWEGIIRTYVLTLMQFYCVVKDEKRKRMVEILPYIGTCHGVHGRQIG
jgi:hypothetical protein